MQGGRVVRRAWMSFCSWSGAADRTYKIAVGLLALAITALLTGAVAVTGSSARTISSGGGAARSRRASSPLRGKGLKASLGGATSVTVGDLVGSAEADGTNVVHVTLTEAAPHGDPSSANWLFLVCPFKGNGPTSAPTVTDTATVGAAYSQPNMIRLPQGVTGVYPFLPNPFGAAVLPSLALPSPQASATVSR